MVRVHKAKAFVMAGALLLTSQLYAQPSNQPAAPTTSAPTTAAPTAAMISKLSAGEMQAQSDRLTSKLNDNAQHAQVAQAQAHTSKDVIKLNCVNDSLVVIKQLQNVGNDTRAKLATAIQSNDRAEQVNQFQKLTSIADNSSEAKQSVDACIGGGDVTVAGSKVVVSHPVIHDDPTNDCNNLGSSNCLSQPLEYVAFASPFSPN